MTERTTLRFLGGPLLALALLAAACGDDSTDSAESSPDATTTTSEAAADDTAADDTTDTTTSEAPTDVELFDSYEGVTADTIKVGVVTADLDELRELGLVDINNGDVPLIWETLVDQVNADGGVLGRDIELVYTEYNPVFTASADEACVRLTQDENVFIVLGGITGPAIDSVVCFVATNETPMLGGTHTPTHLSQATAPWIALSMAAERRHQTTLELYDEAGLIEGNIATFDDSSEHEAITEGVVIPALNDLGYEVTTPLTSNIPQGDEVALADQSRVFAERLVEDDIDTLIIVQSQVALGLAQIREAGYEGTILAIDSAQQLDTIGASDERDPSVYEGSYSPLGLLAEEIYADDLSQECIATFNEVNPDVEVLPSTEVPDGEPVWFNGMLEPCRLLMTFVRIGEAAGADLNPDTFLAAAESLGEFELPGRPFNSLAAGKLDADDGLRIGVFDATVGENGGLVPLGEIQDVG